MSRSTSHADDRNRASVSPPILDPSAPEIGIHGEIQTPALHALGKKLDQRWPALEKAQAQARDRIRQISQILQDDKLIPSDAGFVIFGSLARGECTSGSDVDWTLLIDGQADPAHRRVAQQVDQTLVRAKLKQPSPGGVFGNLAFSHSIIHDIGGQNDTNQNITQRILLLLESRSLSSDDVRRRVIGGVLNRYLEEDISLLTRTDVKRWIPLFLLNDVARFWRTMAVDYASKRQERAGQGWAIRNVKLRMSRKLIFVSGMLACFNCYLCPAQEAGDGAPSIAPNYGVRLIAQLRSYTNRTPLDIVAQALDQYAKKETAAQLFAAYDGFLALLDDEDTRRHLEHLQPEAAVKDRIFQHTRDVSHAFQGALDTFFFDDHPELSKLVRRYGVF